MSDLFFRDEPTTSCTGNLFVQCNEDLPRPEYFDGGNNFRSNVFTACVLIGILSIAVVVGLYMNAPWWYYLIILFFCLVAAIAAIDQISQSGAWAIELTNEGGVIKSPKGVVHFSKDDLIGVYMASIPSHDGDSLSAGAGYYLVLRQGYVYLNNSAIKIFPLIQFIERHYPNCSSGQRVDLRELLEVHSEETLWQQ